jgi:hypothetical protein
MAIPSYGTAGTEVLYRTTINALAAVDTSFRWDRTNATTGTSSYVVESNHIVTVLSIVFCNTAATDRTFEIKLNNGADDIYLLTATPIGAIATYVWNDKFVLVAGDKITVAGSSGSNIDCWCTYIDQAF